MPGRQSATTKSARRSWDRHPRRLPTISSRASRTSRTLQTDHVFAGDPFQIAVAYSEWLGAGMSQVQAEVTECLFYVGPESFTDDDWDWISPRGWHRPGVAEDGRMILVGTNLWSGPAGLRLTVGDRAEAEQGYELCDEVSYPAEAEEPFVTWAFNKDAQPLPFALPAGDYRVILFGSGLSRDYDEATNARDTGERYWMVFEPLA